MRTNQESLQGYVQDTAAWEQAAIEVAAAKRKAEELEAQFKEATKVLVEKGQSEVASTDRVKAELQDYGAHAAAAQTSDDYLRLADHAKAVSKVAHNEHETDLSRARGERAPLHIEQTADVSRAAGEI